MVCVPDLMTVAPREGVDGRELADAQRQIIDHCSAPGGPGRDPRPATEPRRATIAEWRQEAGFDSSFGTMYWPWLEVANRRPATATGTATGRRARSSFRPAGTSPGSGRGSTRPRRAQGAGQRADARRGRARVPDHRAEQDGLNPIGVNCLREFPGTGIRVWGARTLSSTDSSWRYINVRRLFNYLEESILEAMQWVVFEPNDRVLWATIRRQVGSFLVNVWRTGAFSGTPDEAFYVKCDDETNPQEGIEAGEVVCEIGIAAVKPAEFIVFKIDQLPPA